MSNDMSGKDPFPYTLWRNLRFAGRRLRQNPGFALTAILSLAVGIGANIAIFSLVNAVLLRRQPLEKPEEVVEIYLSQPDFRYGTFSYPDYKDLRDDTKDAFAGVSASALTVVQVDRGGKTDMQLAEMVSGNYFSLKGVRAWIGRTLLAEDDVSPGAHPVAVLGYGYWKSAFGGDPGVVGQDVRLTGRAYRVVGVAPEAFTGKLRGIVPAFYIPVMMADELQPGNYSFFDTRRNRSLFVSGRLKPGITQAQAEVSAARVAARLKKENPQGWDPDAGFLLVPESDVILYPPADGTIMAGAWLLAAVVGLVLLTVCTNLTGFLLARSLDRRKETALRFALGATRRKLIGQHTAETLLLAALGGLAGAGLAAWLLKALASADLPIPLPVTLDLRPDFTVFAFGLAVSLAVGVALGLIPALYGTRLDISSSLKEESAGGGISGRRLNLRNGLVTAQIAVSLVLIVVAGLFLRSLQSIRAIDPGFGKSPTAVMTIAISSKRYNGEQARAFLRTLLDRIEQLPGVEAAGVTTSLQLNTLNWSTTEINVDGVEPPAGRPGHTVGRASVDPGFFDAAGIQIIRGRSFNDSDRPDSEPVAIISRAMAERFWPGKDPIGRALHRGNSPDLVVVGVASDTKVRSLGESPQPFLYLPHSQSFDTFMTLIARTSGDAGRTAMEMLAAARKLDPDLWIWEPQTMEEYLGAQLLPFRLAAIVISAFALIAMALASVGLYGTVSYAVSKRIREVGIRMSLGADAGRITKMLMLYGSGLAAAGAVIGLLISAVATTALRGLVFGISSFDPVSYAGALVLLAGVALAACYFPARRASRIDPITALRKHT